jgi:DNA-binding protein
MGFFRLNKDTRVRKLFFNKPVKEMLAEINQRFKISLQNNEDLVNRVYERYPYLTKAEIALIIKETFTSIRDLLFSGEIINLKGFLYDLKLAVTKPDTNLPGPRGKQNIRVVVRTPEDLIKVPPRE